ncbi:MAG: protein tyrosine phosphatase family protein [Methylococcales bacterium]
MDETSIYNYKLLTKDMASGGQPSEDELGYIVKAGYSAVINLGLHNSDYSISKEASFFKDNNVTYIHIPVIFDAPKEKDLDDFTKALSQYKDSKVFIHCAANKRVSVLIALYRILTLDWSTDKAMKELNTVWQPNEVWQSFISQQLTRHCS